MSTVRGVLSGTPVFQKITAVWSCNGIAGYHFDKSQTFHVFMSLYTPACMLPYGVQLYYCVRAINVES